LPEELRRVKKRNSTKKLGEFLLPGIVYIKIVLNKLFEINFHEVLKDL